MCEDRGDAVIARLSDMTERHALQPRHPLCILLYERLQQLQLALVPLVHATRVGEIALRERKRSVAMAKGRVELLVGSEVGQKRTVDLRCDWWSMRCCCCALLTHHDMHEQDELLHR